MNVLELIEQLEAIEDKNDGVEVYDMNLGDYRTVIGVVHDEPLGCVLLSLED